MKFILIFCTFALFEISDARNHCVPKYHYWQPFYETIPPKAFVAGVDTNGEKKYVGRIVSVDERTWSAPTTFSATNMWAYFRWKGETVKRASRFIELLMVENRRPGFNWLHVTSKKDLYNLEDSCCFVEGGYGYKDGEKYTAYVARTFDSGVYYVGALYMPDWNNRDVMHYMQGWESKYIEKNYAVLAYDCCTNNYCISLDTNKLPCCSRSRSFTRWLGNRPRKL